MSYCISQMIWNDKLMYITLQYKPCCTKDFEVTQNWIFSKKIYVFFPIIMGFDNCIKLRVSGITDKVKFNGFYISTISFVFSC